MHRRIFWKRMAWLAWLCVSGATAQAAETNLSRTVEYPLAAVQKAVGRYFEKASATNHSEGAMPTSGNSSEFGGPGRVEGGVFRNTIFNCATRFPGEELTATAIAPGKTLIQVRFFHSHPEAIREQTKYMEKVLAAVQALLARKP